MEKYILPVLVLIFCWGTSSKEVQAKDLSKHKVKDHSMHKDKKHSHKDSSVKKIFVNKDKIVFKVNGMVCAFCAQGIEKNFNKLDEVKSTKVNLDKMEVTLELNKGKVITDKQIKKVVTDAGFAYVGQKK